MSPHLFYTHFSLGWNALFGRVSRNKGRTIGSWLSLAGARSALIPLTFWKLVFCAMLVFVLILLLNIYSIASLRIFTWLLVQRNLPFLPQLSLQPEYEKNQINEPIVLIIQFKLQVIALLVALLRGELLLVRCCDLEQDNCTTWRQHLKWFQRLQWKQWCRDLLRLQQELWV